MVLFVFQFYQVCNFGRFISFSINRQNSCEEPVIIILRDYRPKLLTDNFHSSAFAHKETKGQYMISVCMAKG